MFAVKRAKGNITGLFDQRPDVVTIAENNATRTVKPTSVDIGSIVQLKNGEELALDGELVLDNALGFVTNSCVVD